MKFVCPETASEMMYFTLHFATYTNYADYDHLGGKLEYDSFWELNKEAQTLCEELVSCRYEEIL